MQSLLRLVAVWLGLAASPLAQIQLSGNVSDDTTGPLLAGLTYEAIADLTVPVGKTWTVQPGAELRFDPFTDLVVSGTLDVQGTSGSPVLFTSSNGVPGSWLQVAFGPGAGASILEHLIVEHFGAVNRPGIRLNASIVMRDCTLRDAPTSGVDLDGDTFPIVEGCTFEDLGGYPLDNVAIQAVGDFSSNTAVNCGLGNRWHVTNGTTTGPLSITKTNLVGDVLALHDELIVGSPMSIGAGVAIKFEGAQDVEVYSTFDVLGTSEEPVVITSLADDSVAGDSGGDGPTVGQPGDWVGIRFLSGSGASALEFTEIRNFAGADAVQIHASGVRLSDCTIEDGLSTCLSLRFPASFATIERCAFRDSAGYAATSSGLESVPGFVDNVASGNALGDYLRCNLGSGNVPSSLTIGPRNGFNGVVGVASGIFGVPSGLSLTLEAGLILKAYANLDLRIGGTLDVLGTAQQPVVVTGIADDAIGGDSNADGAATQPVPGVAGRLRLQPGSSGSLEHLWMRYPAGNHGLEVQSSAVHLKDVRIEHASSWGARLDAAGSVDGMILFDCARSGLVLADPNLALVDHVTTVGNGEYGIVASSTFSATVQNSIAWDNALGSYQGFVATQPTWSNGDPALAGTNGNIFADPLFLDEAAGDLRLAFGSPCIDTGNPLSPVDADGSRTDMGALPTSHCTPVTHCTGKVNSEGCVPAIGSTGVPGLMVVGAFDVTAADVTSNKVGTLVWTTLGPAAIPFAGGTLCLQPPFRRTPLQFSGGAAPCGGTFAYDFNALMQSGTDPNLVPGAVVTAQYLFRDPPSTAGLGLSNAIEFGVCP